jgi:ABC-type phosphate/phosphonate transport system permease subunit
LIVDRVPPQILMRDPVARAFCAGLVAAVIAVGVVAGTMIGQLQREVRENHEWTIKELRLELRR